MGASCCSRNHVGGCLRQKGEQKRALKKRYMELNGSVLAYYKNKSQKNGIPLSSDEKTTPELDLDRVSSLQPMTEPFTEFACMMRVELTILGVKKADESITQDHRDSTSRSRGHSSSQREPELNELRKLILLDPLYRFSCKEQLWMHCDEFIDILAALPRILSCVHWDGRDEGEEALKLLPRWPVPDHHVAYIELLNGKFTNEGVRNR
ncbi:Phosphatidylinositol 4,5-bisphosphate 3-kinase catalytic subunit gamma isoform [Phytophthora pseudosyringae]|uniref:Phosphatidylinositol 4,5-bisphosphate 3-kinase catalytic subunit gamma isoform n=1 Tax=Phytophthora pseudosyringae TaxID=221518 RepID=A0A8T1VUX6_9STRA|nr:Phosphatidylinositol 4,5-bisphosphate 3-kinase catalytic subunit gamma isoform [Phytophthora pseudosyringae]